MFDILWENRSLSAQACYFVHTPLDELYDVLDEVLDSDLLDEESRMQYAEEYDQYCTALDVILLGEPMRVIGLVRSLVEYLHEKLPKLGAGYDAYLAIRVHSDDFNRKSGFLREPGVCWNEYGHQRMVVVTMPAYLVFRDNILDIFKRGLLSRLLSRALGRIRRREGEGGRDGVAHKVDGVQ